MNNVCIPFQERRKFMATLNQGGVEWRKMKGMEPDDIALSFSTVAKKSGCAMLSKKFFNSYIAAEIISLGFWHLEVRWQSELKAAIAQKSVTTELILAGIIKWLESSDSVIQSFYNRTYVTGDVRREQRENYEKRENAIRTKANFLILLTESSYLEDGLREGHTSLLQNIFEHYQHMGNITPGYLKSEIECARQIAAKQCGVEC